MRLVPAITAVAVVASFLLCGCDYTRRGGTYRLVSQNQSTRNSAVKVETQDAAALERLVGQWLSEKGFQEFKGKRTIWQKKGASVYVWHEAENEVLIELFAIGSKRDLRLSEQTETELLAYLEKQANLKVIPAPPAKPI